MVHQTQPFDPQILAALEEEASRDLSLDDLLAEDEECRRTMLEKAQNDPFYRRTPLVTERARLAELATNRQ